MPPALSDDEVSDASGVGAVTTPPPAKRGKKVASYANVDNSDEDSASEDTSKKRTSTARANGSAAGVKATKAKKEEVEEEDDDEDNDDDMEVDEYEVESIVSHMLDDERNVRFRVKWKGYSDPSENTWEPEDNLADNATDIVDEYIAKIGGREKLYEKPAKGKKRGRPPAASTTAATTTTVTKRPRKSDVHPADRESPSAAVAKPFKPPAGSWEDDVVDVEMFRDEKGELKVCLTWKNGEKTQHLAQQSYIRCPQKMLRFYESRISFKASAQE